MTTVTGAVAQGGGSADANKGAAVAPDKDSNGGSGGSNGVTSMAQSDSDEGKEKTYHLASGHKTSHAISQCSVNSYSLFQGFIWGGGGQLRP